MRVRLTLTQFAVARPNATICRKTHRRLRVTPARRERDLARRPCKSAPSVGSALSDYDYTFQDPINMVDLDGALPKFIKDAANGVSRGASSAGKFAWKHRAEIAFTAASFAPGLGQVAMGIRMVRLANAARLAAAGSRAAVTGTKARRAAAICAICVSLTGSKAASPIANTMKATAARRAEMDAVARSSTKRRATLRRKK